MAKSIMIKIISFVWVCFWGMDSAWAAPNVHNLPSFDDIAAVSSQQRQIYLAQLSKEIKKSQNDFLEKVIYTTTTRKVKTCFAGVFGNRSNAKLANTRKACPQDLQSASTFFGNPENKQKWTLFRIKIGIRCLSSVPCRAFQTHQYQVGQTSLRKTWGQR